MLKCNKRQKIVKRSNDGSSVTFRCMNKQSGLAGQEVDESVCSRCPVRSIEHKRPCKKRAAAVVPQEQEPVTTEEFNSISDDELREMIEDAGLDSEEMSKADVTPIGPSQPPPNFPPISLQLWTYKEALIKWARAGRPIRTQEEVDRLHKICTGGDGKPKCEWYDEKTHRCRGCGCRVTVSSIAISNKLKMATEHCPKDRF